MSGDASIEFSGAGYRNALSYGASTDPERDGAMGINAALGRAKLDGGGEVYLPAGTYWLRSTVVVPAGCTLRGAGDATVLKAAPGLNADLVSGEAGARRIRVSALVVDGNRASQTGPSNGIALTSCEDLRLEAKIRDCFTDGLALSRCPRPVLGVVSEHNGRHGVNLEAVAFPSGQVVARNNGQTQAGSGLALGGVDGVGTTDASLILVATDTQEVKTQQYGVLEAAGQGCDRNCLIGSCTGNTLGTASLAGATSMLIGGAVSSPVIVEGGTATSVVTSIYDGGAALAAPSNAFDGGSAAG